MMNPILPIFTVLLSANPAAFAQNPEKSPSDTISSVSRPANQPLTDETRQEGRKALSLPADVSGGNGIPLPSVPAEIRELSGKTPVVPASNHPALPVPSSAYPHPPGETGAAVRFSVTGQSVYYHGLGGYMSAEGIWRWTTRKGWLEAGIVTGKRFLFAIPGGENMLGATLRTGWDITGRLGVRVYGQYLFLNGAAPLSQATLPFPHTEAGASLFYRIDGNARVEGGFLYRYDDNRQKWNSVTGGKLSIGF